MSITIVLKQRIRSVHMLTSSHLCTLIKLNDLLCFYKINEKSTFWYLLMECSPTDWSGTVNYNTKAPANLHLLVHLYCEFWWQQLLYLSCCMSLCLKCSPLPHLIKLSLWFNLPAYLPIIFQVYWYTDSASILISISISIPAELLYPLITVVYAC